MDIRQAIHFEQAETLNTEELRRHFLVEGLFVTGKLRVTYSHYDRLVLLGISPVTEPIIIADDLANVVGVSYFLERRELAVVNIGGGPARISADGEDYLIEPLEALYVGRGTKSVVFAAADQTNPPKLYGVSAPAHKHHPSRKISQNEASPQALGTVEAANKRTIYKYVHEGLLPTCQLMLGITRFEPGSVWNTMPAHLHDRRMEAYLYFDMPADRFVVHLMGRPHETRHLIVRNEQAVISPPWSIHSGSGTGSYAFVWAMAGDNQSFVDMDMVSMESLR
ncbi:5-dehydro-4-deoxy-D-glucuronate isomerase [Phyllobacterium myrsinacearum]|uniref:4-deoxy-L-threo-5-hexosulose-uronate ketol-isomerase n=1 Tax=Phyllobacterium myrsinacearum TaxID=28101 RepID=A0A839ELT4_9HYPH|nr:5-dehydro-4-deoxy-D-glucuronate isomerase [Phyllobacterium myrsinacearum]MBA8881001.1 4-deoxy-L-threo-5-hexosulose-uronate ketol-isomerase [Phyllobacterium myrsinacearum]